MTNNIPTSLIILLLIQAFWIIVFFGLIQHLLLKAIRNERWHDRVAFYNPLIRNIVWVLFAIKVVYSLASENLFVSLAVVGAVLALGWQPIRDFIQGTIFRFQKGDIRGQLLKVKDYQGVVNKMQNTKIELVTNNEEIIQIPYSWIISAITTKPTATKHLTTASIFVKLSDKNDVEATKLKIKKQLLNTPWVVSSKEVKVEKVEGKQKLKVSFSTLNGAFVDRVRGLLQIPRR